MMNLTATIGNMLTLQIISAVFKGDHEQVLAHRQHKAAKYSPWGRHPHKWNAPEIHLGTEYREDKMWCKKYTAEMTLFYLQ